MRGKQIGGQRSLSLKCFTTRHAAAETAHHRRPSADAVALCATGPLVPLRSFFGGRWVEGREGGGEATALAPPLPSSTLRGRGCQS